MSTHSDPDRTPAEVSARFSDGATARSAVIHVRLGSSGLVLRGLPDQRADGVWPYDELHTETPVSKSAGDVLLNPASSPGATLYIENGAFIAALVERAPHLTTSALRWKWAKPALAAAAAVAVIVLGIWQLELKPARGIAKLLPQSARVKLGTQVVHGLARSHPECVAPKGRVALETMFKRLLPDPKARAHFSITALDWSIVNAFAAPGGQMVITQGLIHAAQSPEEVAGVLAHEIGHGLELHPESGLVRSIGMSFVLDLMLGGSTGTLGGITGHLLQTQYVREDERAADLRGLALLSKAGVSQDGLASFFNRLSKKSGEDNIPSALNILSTHPPSRERAEYVRNTPRYPTRPILSPQQWRDLKNICSQKRKP